MEERRATARTKTRSGRNPELLRWSLHRSVDLTGYQPLQCGFVFGRQGRCYQVFLGDESDLMPATSANCSATLELTW